MCKQIETYNSKSHQFSVVKPFWPVHDSQTVTDAINKPKVGNKALSRITYDFSSLYTNMQYNKLKSVMRELISFCFKGGRKHIDVTHFSGTWTDDKYYTY